jgi:hypothetical protein
LVELVDNRNSEDKVKKLLGINVNKVFMPSKANVTESNLSKYKIIKKRQFAYSAMQVGRDETVRVVLYSFDEPAIISPAYSVFSSYISISSTTPRIKTGQSGFMLAFNCSFIRLRVSKVW